MNLFITLEPKIIAHSKALAGKTCPSANKACNASRNILGQMRLCHLGLRNILARKKFYETYCIMTSPFRAHFARIMDQSSLNEDELYALLEDMAVFAYEAQLRSHKEHLSETEEALLAVTLMTGSWEQTPYSMLHQYIEVLIPQALSLPVNTLHFPLQT